MRNTNAKNFVLLTIIVLGLLFLSGFGCQKGEEPTAPDASVSEVPEGWKVYTSEEWKVSIAYPPGWYFRERTSEEIQNTNMAWVDFNSEPIHVLTEADPVYPVSLIVTQDTNLDEAMADYLVEGIENREEVAVNNQQFTKITYLSDLLGDVPVVAYLLEYDNKVYEVTGPKQLPELWNFVTSMAVDGGK